MIDAHLHADCRPVENFKEMNISGINAVISLAHDPLKMSQSIVSLEHFDRIVFQEAKRVEKSNINYYCGVGVHPRAIPSDYEVVLNKLPEYLENEHVIAIGEIGLETTSELEKKVFVEQLKIADENNYKVIVHTPRTNKSTVTSVTTDLIDENIDPKLVQLDHIDFSIINQVIDKGYTLGITVQPLKMSPKDTVKLLDEYGFDKFVLDSDISSAPSNHLSLAETRFELIKNSFSKSNIDKVTFKNVSNFHNIEF